MIANALLVRWSGGWTERTNGASVTARGRREALFGIGAIQSEGEAHHIADQQLEVWARDRLTTAADIDPVSDNETPYLGYRIGDTLEVPSRFMGDAEPQRVVAMTVVEDDDGNLTYAPEFGDVVLDDRERFELSLKKFSDGTMAGNSKVATPVSSIPSTADCCPPDAYSGDV